MRRITLHEITNDFNVSAAPATPGCNSKGLNFEKLRLPNCRCGLLTARISLDRRKTCGHRPHLQRFEGLRIMRVKPHWLSCIGMAKLQMHAMQCEAADRIRPAAIAFVADDRMPAFGEVHTDLMFPAGFEAHFDERGFWISLHDVNVRDCEFS